jgi:2'-5' RNA ligase
MAVGAFTHRPLPLPLKWQRTDEGGHTTSVVVGSMDKLDILDDGVWGEGEMFDDVSPTVMPRLAEDVAEAKELLSRKVIGPSVDPGSARAVTVMKGSDKPLDDQAIEQYWMRHGTLPETELLFTNYEIAAATLVPVPAFAQCRPFELFDAPAETVAADARSLVAAATPMPALDPALFQNPNLSTYTPATMVDLGNGWTHVFGHVAAHRTCHVGMRGVCTTAPYSDHDYMPFHRYSVTKGGHELPVVAGRLTSGLGRMENLCGCHPGNDDHACGNLSMGGAVAHHDRMEVLAYVCVGEDEALDAVWFSGVLNPEASEEARQVLSRRKVSGDWREYGASMELVEVLVLARREPGFPLPRMSMENGRQLSLTAAGAIMPELAVDEFTNLQPGGWGDLPSGGGSELESADEGATPVAFSSIDYDRLGTIVAEKLMAAATPPPLDDLPAAADGDEELCLDDDGELCADHEAVTAAARTAWSGLPIAPNGTTWDKGAAVRRLVEWADGDIAGKYARAFLWRDPDADPSLQGAYKLPIADVIDGKLTIVPNAVRNAAARLDQVDGLGPDEQERLRGVLDGLLERVRDSVTAAAKEGGHTGAMVALRMTDADAERMAVEGGLPPHEMHMTLAYLGESADISDEAREKIVRGMGRIAKKVGGPLEADAFSVNAFNPGDANDRPTAIVMGINGAMLGSLQQGVCKTLGNCEGFAMPEQHEPWTAHTTLAYDGDLSKMEQYADRVGPLTFDRLRVAFGDDVTDIPLGEIIKRDEADQVARDAEDAMYARTARANQLAAELWAVAEEARREEAAEMIERINAVALAAAE